jgi:hypothetical protein
MSNWTALTRRSSWIYCTLSHSMPISVARSMAVYGSLSSRPGLLERYRLLCSAIALSSQVARWALWLFGPARTRNRRRFYTCAAAAACSLTLDRIFSFGQLPSHFPVPALVLATGRHGPIRSNDFLARVVIHVKRQEFSRGLPEPSLKLGV